MTLRWPSPPDLGAVPTVTELYAEIARLEFFIGHQAKFIEEQRVLLMDLRLQRDEAIKTAGSPCRVAPVDHGAQEFVRLKARKRSGAGSTAFVDGVISKSRAGGKDVHRSWADGMTLESRR